ncbi:putative kinase [Streptosporangium album]|uniref:Putative kinase n=1 Tax=Streptosporangium album TaxID=47479 RepID=A0A7W7S570_9ACTN|nr:AAA family ATPase [Streptosporangium album]MBB4943478.1 putative kinase [Streptosporangium album]
MSGPPGTGKTTLAHELARILGCPAVVRDEIKQGMVLAIPEYEPSLGDWLNHRTLGAFFGVLRVLLEAGSTVIAEAAFQDRVWSPHLEPLTGLAQIRIIRCTAPAAVIGDRIIQRAKQDVHRTAHADHTLIRAIEAGQRPFDSFVPISLDAPTVTVDTSVSYQPSLMEVAAFISSPGCTSPSGGPPEAAPAG